MTEEELKNKEDDYFVEDWENKQRILSSRKEIQIRRQFAMRELRRTIEQEKKILAFEAQLVHFLYFFYKIITLFIIYFYFLPFIINTNYYFY